MSQNCFFIYLKSSALSDEDRHTLDALNTNRTGNYINQPGYHLSNADVVDEVEIRQFVDDQKKLEESKRNQAALNIINRFASSLVNNQMLSADLSDIAQVSAACYELAKVTIVKNAPAMGSLLGLEDTYYPSALLNPDSPSSGSFGKTVGKAWETFNDQITSMSWKKANENFEKLFRAFDKSVQTINQEYLKKGYFIEMNPLMYKTPNNNIVINPKIEIFKLSKTESYTPFYSLKDGHDFPSFVVGYGQPVKQQRLRSVDLSGEFGHFANRDSAIPFVDLSDISFFLSQVDERCQRGKEAMQLDRDSYWLAEYYSKYTKNKTDQQKIDWMAKVVANHELAHYWWYQDQIPSDSDTNEAQAVYASIIFSENPIEALFINYLERSSYIDRDANLTFQSGMSKNIYGITMSEILAKLADFYGVNMGTYKPGQESSWAENLFKKIESRINNDPNQIENQDVLRDVMIRLYQERFGYDLSRLGYLHPSQITEFRE